MDGHGTSPKGRCEGILDPSEVSSLGKLSVFSNNQLGHSNIVQHGFKDATMLI